MTHPIVYGLQNRHQLVTAQTVLPLLNHLPMTQKDVVESYHHAHIRETSLMFAQLIYFWFIRPVTPKKAQGGGGGIKSDKGLSFFDNTVEGHSGPWRKQQIWQKSKYSCGFGGLSHQRSMDASRLKTPYFFLPSKISQTA